MSFLEQNAMETLIRRQVDQLFAQQYANKTQARARISLSANTGTIPVGTYTPLQMDTEDYDTDNMYDPAIKGRLTCRTPGTYLCQASLSLLTGTGVAYPAVRKNGLAITQGDMVAVNNTYGQGAVAMSVEILAINDFIEAVAYVTVAQSLGAGAFLTATRIQ